MSTHLRPRLPGGDQLVLHYLRLLERHKDLPAGHSPEVDPRTWALARTLLRLDPRDGQVFRGPRDRAA